MSDMLIVYYSQIQGNTKYIIDKCEKEFNADIIRIDTVEPYEGNIDEISAQAEHEIFLDFKPEIIPNDIKIDGYKKILIGTPTWWYTMAPAVLTFISSQNWAGKNVALFATDAGCPGHCIEDMIKLCKGANIFSTRTFEFNLHGTNYMITPEKDLKAWIKEIKSF